jgi:hypothetical protein
MSEIPVRKAADLLGAFLDQNLSTKAAQTSSFFKSWRHAVGQRLASHSKIADIQNGILIVETDHPAWIQLLQLREAEILSFMKINFPDFPVRALIFKLNNQYFPSRGRASEEPSEPPDDAVPTHSTAEIKDEKLKQSLERLKQAYQERLNERQPQKPSPRKKKE